MSESDRMPGYRNRSQVPPMASRASKIAYEAHGHFGLHVVARADAGQAGADDQDVEVLHGGQLLQALAAEASLSLRVPCSPKSSVRHRSTSSSVLLSSGWKSGRL